MMNLSKWKAPFTNTYQTSEMFTELFDPCMRLMGSMRKWQGSLSLLTIKWAFCFPVKLRQLIIFTLILIWRKQNWGAKRCLQIKKEKKPIINPMTVIKAKKIIIDIFLCNMIIKYSKFGIKWIFYLNVFRHHSR